MSAAEKHLDESPEQAESPEVAGQSGMAGLSAAASLVEVRRNAGVAAGIGLVSSAVSIAYLARAATATATSSSVLDWALVVVMGVLGMVWLASFVDARTPLLVADAQGVRLRLGRTWRGLPWSAVEQVEHRPRRGLLRDGRIVVVPRNPEKLLAELDRRSARQARWSTRLYGGPLALPLGLTTKVQADGDLTTALARLADRGAEVVVLAPEVTAKATTETELPEIEQPEIELPEAVAPEAEATSARPRLRDPRPLLATALTRISARIPGRPFDEETAEPDTVVEASASATPEPTRDAVPPSRAEVRRIAARVAPAPQPEATPHDETTVFARPDVELVEDDQDWADRVTPISREGHPVAPLVFDDFVVEPAADPVIGPELRAARTRLGLSVDQLAERTRIRPHVIEAIEVDDFVPCGGDFYARGHLRTLARVLGVDVTGLLDSYDERYAHAPIDPRRVFEAELATGSHGSIRGTRGGLNWSILVAAVMAMVLAWSIARLVMDAPTDLTARPVLNGSGGPHGGSAVAADPVPVVISAPAGGAQVVVRDSSGAIVFKGNLAIGESTTVEASPPLRVQTTDGAVTVTVAGVDRGPVGEPGVAGQGTYAGD